MLLPMDDRRILSGDSAIYRSYLLRLWRDETAHGRWHAMLESVTEPGVRLHFADMPRLLAFLHATCALRNIEPSDTS